MTVVSADWVLPVDGEPIEDGAVVFEDGRIVAVGRRAELGEGERFFDAAIVPGFVNAHTHLEYAVYAGFGDGLAFGPWLHLHIERKSRIGWDQFVAMLFCQLGRAYSLREICGGLASCEGKLAHLGATAPARCPRPLAHFLAAKIAITVFTA